MLQIARIVAVPALVLSLAACGESGPVNPPTEPAAPIAAGDPTAPAARGQTSMLPGRGAQSFVGRWAANVEWCANPRGAERPIEISSTRFEGYENSCEIAAVEEVADGYVTTLACMSEGTANSERVRFQVTGDTMRMTYMDRGGEPVELNKCTTLEDTATKPTTAP